MKIFTSILVPTFLLTSNLLSSTIDNNITVYNNDLRFFDETKNINKINKGIDNIIYENISPNLIQDSVSISLNNDIKLLEQNYKFDLVNFNNILKHYINKEIIYIDNTDEKNITKLKAILLSVENNNVVIKDISTNNISLIPSKNVIVDKLPDGMITKPSLIFKTNSENEYNNLNINLKYLSYGFNWKADYVLTLDGDNLISNGWITLTNNTDLFLNNYNLKLVSGNVNNVDTINNYNPRIMKQKNMLAESSMVRDTVVKENSFSGYHIYTIPFKVDIDAKTQKQINFINFQTKNWNKINKLELNNIDTMKYKFNQIIKFENKKEYGLGMRLPEGNVRVYGKNLQDNSLTFIGSNKIENTPENEKIEINIGENFDSVLETTLVENNKNNYIIKYDLRNNSKDEQTYVIKQNIYNFDYNHNYEKMFYESSCIKDNKCKIKEISHNVIEYELTLNKFDNFNFKTIYSNTNIKRLD